MSGLRHRALILAGVLVVAAVVAGALMLRHGTGSGAAGPAQGPSAPPAAGRAAHRLHPVSPYVAAAQRLSLEQLAGQRIIYAYSGVRPPRSLLDAIKAGKAAGVIFFENNISSVAQIRGVIGRLQNARRSSPVRTPLLMMTDQEGGEVRRLPGAPELSEKLIGESAHAVALARSAGAGAARNLRDARMRVNLAPVLDVFRTPGDFVDEFHRSYSSDPAVVGRLGGAFISAQQRAGVLATAKHFPGLGTAARDQNTDEGPVTLHTSLSSLRGVDEAPYRAAIAAGVKLVMSSWAVYPALDPRRPAGLSAAVIQKELRGRLGFRGVTITDSLTAGALRGYGSLQRRGLMAARAGADLLLVSGSTPDEGTAVLHALSTALRRGNLSRAAARASAARVLALRAQIG
jgi:beta-N-acetylhexosaminidase